MKLEENSCILVGIMNHQGKNGRNHEYQDSNDSASTPESSNWIINHKSLNTLRKIEGKFFTPGSCSSVWKEIRPKQNYKFGEKFGEIDT